MRMDLLRVAVLFLVAFPPLVVFKLRLPAAAAWLSLGFWLGVELGSVLSLWPGIILGSVLGFWLGVILDGRQAVVLCSGLGGILSGGLGGILSSRLGGGLDIVLGFALIGVLSGGLYGLGVALSILRSVSRKGPTKAIEAPDDARPPQFAEYLLYFLPKAIREPLAGDLEEEYREVYARFGRRKATVWYYAQVMQSYWPLLCRAARKLVTWGVFGWIGDAVRWLIS